MVVSDRKHIVLLCSRLDLPGGIERAVVNTANLLESKGHAVTLLILDVTKQSFYPVSEGVGRVELSLNFGIVQNGTLLSRKILFLKHVCQLRTILRQLRPDVVIGTEYAFTIAAYIATRRLALKLFAWEHHHIKWLQKSFFWNILFRNVYPKLHGVVCLNVEEATLYSAIKCKTYVIPNFVERRTRNEVPTKTILFVGWFIKRKGVDRLPFLAEQVAKKYHDWKWIVIGTGDEEQWLKQEIKKRNLQDKVTIKTPASPDLSSAYSEAALFVLPSRFECFPMVLLEAMSYGVPCVSFDCPTGPGFIITNEADGLLIENEAVEAMAKGLLNVIGDEEKRSSMSEAAYENVLRFSADTIYELWQALLAE